MPTIKLTSTELEQLHKRFRKRNPDNLHLISKDFNCSYQNIIYLWKTHYVTGGFKKYINKIKDYEARPKPVIVDNHDMTRPRPKTVPKEWW